MARRTINVGTPPGNLGDGDTLRDAFIKTNANFDDLYLIHPVVDVTLDHDDPSVEGTIAKALEDAGNAGGGLVLVGSGTFNCPNTTLRIPENVTLKGLGRNATVIDVTGSQDGITVDFPFASVESLRLQMPRGISGDGIKQSAGYVHFRDLYFSGGSALSWGINADSVNVCSIENIAMGATVPSGSPLEFTGNGILWRNSDPLGKPFNFGDSRLSKVDITLAANNTTGIKFHGPDDSDNTINNILLSQVEIIGTGITGGCTGLHLRNAQRITCQTVDIEQTNTAILEESAGTGKNKSGNNVYISTFIFAAASSYTSSGIVNRRLFLGCDNLSPQPINDNDVLLPEAIWLNNGTLRLQSPTSGILEIDAGDGTDGIQLSAKSLNPIIRPSNLDAASLLTLGAVGTQGVECKPGVVLPLQSTVLLNVTEGMLVQYAAGVVGTQRGLYQLRANIWVFIG